MRSRYPNSRTYCVIVASLLLLLSTPQSPMLATQKMVGALMGSTWNWLSTLAITSQPLGSRPLKAAVSQDNRRVVNAKEEIQRLELENRQLKHKIKELQTLLVQEQTIANPTGLALTELTAAQERRRVELKKLTMLQLANVPARVIYRSPTSWNSTLWINVGSSTNASLQRTVIAKNSPVVMGNCLIGVVDLVNANQCRVRLVTDSGVVPSVRVLRGEQLLAKGELHGSGLPLWRQRGQLLQGIGFNYDFSDDEGPALDLRSGRPVGDSKSEPLALVQVGDALITTGMDGLFPAGLNVAEVTSLKPLREGDYFFQLEADLAAGDLDNLSLVTVLPPVGYQSE